MEALRKPVAALDDNKNVIQTYPSIEHAKKDYGKVNIGNACKTGIKAGNVYWKFIDKV